MDAIVSPANSFGFMDGGIDMVGTFAETFSSVTESGKMSWGRREYSTNFVYREAPPQGSFRRYSTDKWYSFHLPTLEKFPIVAIKIELIKLDAINV